MSEAIISAGGLEIKAPSAEASHLTMLIWGDSGSGKTTLACTAPGNKLLIMFDPGGDVSLAGREDVFTLDMTSETPLAVSTKFRSADPYDLNKVLLAHPHIETVVVDSMTALAYIALQEAVLRAGGKSSLEQPGMQGYTYRNALVLRMTMVIMRICAVQKRHLILVTHEGSGDRNEDGVITSITMALSDSVANQVGLRFNEVWHLTDNGKDHVIAVRPCRLRKPMKTRMFKADKPEFVWHYTPDTQEGDGITDWFQAWKEGGGKQIALPSVATSSAKKGAKK